MSTPHYSFWAFFHGLHTIDPGCILRQDSGPFDKAQGGAEPGAVVPTVASAPSGGPQEGIKVHGHWTIEVRNPDGTLASRREFQNALDSFGASALTKVLARQNSVGIWNVGLWHVAPPNPSACPSGVNGICNITEIASGDPDPGTFKTLTVTVPTTGPNAGKLVLSGTATAEANGLIVRVFTLLGLCSPTVAATSCTVFRQTSVTSTDLTLPVSVSAGQQIQVTVVISFS